MTAKERRKLKELDERILATKIRLGLIEKPPVRTQEVVRVQPQQKEVQGQTVMKRKVDAHAVIQLVCGICSLLSVVLTVGTIIINPKAVKLLL